MQQRTCIILLGPPGAGKGTQAGFLSSRFGFAVIASGVLLRAHASQGTNLGKQASSYMERGDLVPDELVTAMIADAVRTETSDLLVVEGYPKSLKQAQQLDAVLAGNGYAASAAISIEVDTTELAKRLILRARESGRDDDTPDVIQHRLQLTGVPPADMLAFYEQSSRINLVNGMRTPEDVHASIVSAISGQPP